MEPRNKKIAVTIAVVGAVAVIWILYWTLTSGARYGLECSSNLKAIGGVLTARGARKKLQTPPSLESIAGPRGARRRCFVCPATGSKLDPGVFPRDYDSLMERAGRSVSLSGLDGSQIPLVWDREPVHDGKRNVLFADGGIQTLGKEKFEAALRRIEPLVARKRRDARRKPR